MAAQQTARMICGDSIFTLRALGRHFDGWLRWEVIRGDSMSEYDPPRKFSNQLSAEDFSGAVTRDVSIPPQ